MEIVGDDWEGSFGNGSRAGRADNPFTDMKGGKLMQG